MSHSSQQPQQWTCCLLWLLAEKLGKVQCWCFVCNVSLNVFYKFTGGCGNPPRPSQQPAYFLSHLLPTNIGKLGSLLHRHRQRSAAVRICSGCAQNIQFSPPGNCPLSDNAMHDIPGTRTSSHSNVSLEQKHGFEYFPSPCSSVQSVYQVPTLARDPADIWAVARDSDGDNVSEALIMNQITSIRMR